MKWVLLVWLFCGVAFAQTAWLPEIQDTIAAADGPGGYYATTYRKAEPFFWQQIPVWMQEDAAQRKVDAILDIGCGYGALLSLATRVYKARGFCLDVNDYIRPAVMDKYGIEFRRGNIELDPIPWPRSFDVILMTEVLEHFNFNPTTTVRKIHEALSPGGKLFLSTPDEKQWGRQYRYYSSLKKMPPPSGGHQWVDDHVWIYSRKELVQTLQSAGFMIQRLEYSPGQKHRHFNVEANR